MEVSGVTQEPASSESSLPFDLSPEKYIMEECKRKEILDSDNMNMVVETSTAVTNCSTVDISDLSVGKRDSVSSEDDKDSMAMSFEGNHIAENMGGNKYQLSNGSLSMEFRLDQIRDDNFTDLDIICEDGYVAVHRCLLMGASEFLRSLLISRDIMETTAITLPDVSVRHISQVLSLLYGGKTVIDKSDEGAIFSVMTMLGLPVNDLMCRTAKQDDMKQLFVLRYTLNEDFTHFNSETGEGGAICAVAESDTFGSFQPTVETTASQIQDECYTAKSSSDIPPELDNFTSGETSAASCGGVVDEETLDEYVCAKCGSINLSENGLMRHLQTSKTCSTILQWIKNGACVRCEYKPPPEGTVSNLINHLVGCIAEDEQHEEDLINKLSNGSPPQSANVNVEDDNFQNMPNLRKRSMTKMINEVDGNSVCSSSTLCSSVGSKPSKKKKIIKENKSRGRCDSFNEFIQQLTTTPKTYVDVDQDTIRTEFGITSDSDIQRLAMEDLLVLFKRCHVCRFMYPKMKNSSRCLRNHGYRICWVCLRLLPVHGPEFEQHNKLEHLGVGESDTKVVCPFCVKEFDCNIGLPTHMGNYHCPRVIECISNSENPSILNLNSNEVKTEVHIPDEFPTISISCNSQSVPLISTQPEVLVKTEPIEPEYNENIDTLSHPEAAVCESGSCETNQTSLTLQTAQLFPVPSNIASSMDELSALVKTCQICNRKYHFSENSTKCLKAHGYKRCWACIKVFPLAELAHHVRLEHASPEKPRIVECFLCSNLYAYDKGLNLHIGKHLAVYERKIGIKPPKKRSSKPVKDTLMDEIGDLEGSSSLCHIAADTSMIPDNSNQITEKEEECAGESKMESEVKEDVENVALGKLLDKSDQQSDKVPYADESEQSSGSLAQLNSEAIVKSDGEAQERPASRSSTTSSSRFFLEVKEINGIKYNIYGLLDPVKGVESGKTIAIMVSDQSSTVSTNTDV